MDTTVAISPTLFSRTMEFVQAVRDAGIETDPARVLDFYRSLKHIDFGEVSEVRAAARATLVFRHEDQLRFDEVFREFWFGQRRPRLETDEQAGPEPGGEDDAPGLLAETPRAEGGDEQSQPTGYSPEDLIRTKDLTLLNDEELERARRIVKQFVALFANVRGRRYVRSPRGRNLDFRRILRRTATSGGIDLSLFYRQRDIRKLRLLLLCDVSGSMESYSHFLIEFIYGLRQELSDTEVAVFATHMTVITDLLERKAIADSMRQVTRRARDWGGGTNIGGCLRDFNERYARDLLHADSVVVILSDGWDRGDPELMREQIALLARRAYKVIWLNPLLGHANYEPLTRGIRTALPFIDYFLPVHNLESLGRFARTLRTVWH